MKKELMMLMLPFIISIVLIFAVEISSLKKDTQTSSTKTSVEGQELFVLTNNERTESLSWSDCLSSLAVGRSKDMVERDYFSHEDPETGSVETWDKIAASCGQYKIAGENIVMRFSDYQEAHRALMGSKLHRKNILDDRFTEMGVGCYGNICTELFGNF